MRSASIAALLLGLSVSPAAAQTAEVRDSLQRTLRGSLRVLSTAQEWFFTEHRSYTRDLEALAAAPIGRPQEDVQVVVWHASASGWAMEARRPELPGQSCVFWYGRGAPELLSLEKHLPASSTPGRVLCDFDSARAGPGR